MRVFHDAFAILRMELTLYKRFPKLRISTVGIVIIPALYALIYLSSVRDPGAHTGDLKAAIVNLDQGLIYRDQSVNMGEAIVASLKQKRTFGFIDYPVEDEAKRAVREGDLGFALIIPRDFSANAVPGNEAAGGRLVLYVSEGNNYNGANLAKRFASELGHQVNINLNEKRWSLVLTKATGSVDKLAQLRKGVEALKDGAHRVDAGVAQAETGSKALASGADGLSAGVGQLTDGVKQLAAGLRTMDQQRPAPQELNALKSGAGELNAGHAALAQGLQELQGGAQKLADGIDTLRDQAQNIPLVGGRVAEGAGQLANGANQLGSGLQTARTAQAQLAEGTQKLGAGVGKLSDGMGALGAGIHTAANKTPSDAKLDELSGGGRSVASGAQGLQGGLRQLRAGSRELSGGLDLLYQTLPADTSTPDGNARGLADSVEPALEIVAPVPNNGAGYAPNFLATSLWLGAVMSAFLLHLGRLPLAAGNASRPAKLMGKMGLLAGIVAAQSMVVLLMSLFLLGLHVSRLAPFALTLVLTSLTFLMVIVALARAFGDTGKALILLLLIFQLSSSGGIMPVELSGGIYQALSPWLPFTWVIKAFRASMFGAYDGGWFGAWLAMGAIAGLASLLACFGGAWELVGPEDHRPAMDIS